MYKKKTIGISIPAYNEEKHIEKTINGVPDYIDYIVVTNDASKDKTAECVRRVMATQRRVQLIDLEQNIGGPGGPILHAHNQNIQNGADILVVINGDNQMDLNYLPNLLDAVIDENYDYAKGNRFFHIDELKKMPKLRLIGNILVSFLTKFSTGYWSIADPLNGYTAIKVDVFKKLDQKAIGKVYDFEVSLMGELAMEKASIKDVFIPAIYADEQSKVKFFRDTFRELKTLSKSFLKRIFVMYFLFNFHPIALFYLFGAISTIWGVFFGILVTIISWGSRSTTSATVMVSVVPFILGIQFLLQAIVLDVRSEPQKKELH